jgi:hypothetical protein
MEADLTKLTKLIEETDVMVDEIKVAAAGIPAVDQNVVRIKACLKMLKIGIVEPLELAK